MNRGIASRSLLSAVWTTLGAFSALASGAAEDSEPRRVAEVDQPAAEILSPSDGEDLIARCWASAHRR